MPVEFNIQVLRHWFYDQASLGIMKLKSTFACLTLEDTARALGVKVYGKTAIPEGRFRVIIDQSVRFNRRMPHVLDVPGFSGIRIHAGNTDKDTEGCILVGFARDGDKIYESARAFEYVFKAIDEAIMRGEEVWLEVKNEII